MSTDSTWGLRERSPHLAVTSSLEFQLMYFKIVLICGFLCSATIKLHETALTWEHGTYHNLALCLLGHDHSNLAPE